MGWGAGRGPDGGGGGGGGASHEHTALHWTPQTPGRPHAPGQQQFAAGNPRPRYSDVTPPQAQKPGPPGPTQRRTVACAVVTHGGRASGGDGGRAGQEEGPRGAVRCGVREKSRTPASPDRRCFSKQVKRTKAIKHEQYRGGGGGGRMVRRGTGPAGLEGVGLPPATSSSSPRFGAGVVQPRPRHGAGGGAGGGGGGRGEESLDACHRHATPSAHSALTPPAPPPHPQPFPRRRCGGATTKGAPFQSAPSTPQRPHRGPPKSNNDDSGSSLSDAAGHARPVRRGHPRRSATAGQSTASPHAAFASSKSGRTLTTAPICAQPKYSPDNRRWRE